MKHINLTPPLYTYLLQVSLREHPVLRELRDKTAELTLHRMQIPPEQGQFMQMLLRMIEAKRVLELGTFTGYSALAMALALPDDGEVITCDSSAQWTADTQYYWQKAHQDHKITLHLGPALQTLQKLSQKRDLKPFDFIFIDADKTNYFHYYEAALQLVRPGGLIAIDNVLWNGDVIDPNIHNGQTREIRRLNKHIQQDNRVAISLLAMGDGVFLVQKLKEPPCMLTPVV